MALTSLFTRALATFTALKTVNITDGEHLKEYLCSSERTIAPYTHLVMKHTGWMHLNNTGVICLVENTTNIYISAWQDDAYQRPVIVLCEPGGGGFSFFNVTDLTIESIQFRCGWWAIPAAATKYINGSDQFFYYDDAQTTFLFNHCINLTLHNALGSNPDVNNISMIGVNLCGWSNITAVIPDRDLPTTPLSTLLIYYTDSAIMPSNSECHLHVESNILSGHRYIDIEQDLTGNNTERMPVLPIRDFAVYIAQQGFKVNVDITVHPMLYYQDTDYCERRCGLNAIIMFINSVTDSHVTFQGYPYEFCTDKGYIPYPPSNNQFYRSMQLDVIFYETPSFNGSAIGNRMMPLSIQNTSFAFYMGNSVYDYDGMNNHILRVLDFSRKLSYQVAIENVAWCNNSIFFIPFSIPKWFHLLHAKSFFPGRRDQALRLKMNNVYAQHNIYGGADPLRQRNSDSLVQFVNIACTVSGESYFGQNCGGSVIGVVSSNLTITGNLTVCDGYAYKGGGIRLDSYSYLFLKEPLVARFINNSAQQGSAIFAPVHMNSANIIEPIAIGLSTTVGAQNLRMRTVQTAKLLVRYK